MMATSKLPYAISSKPFVADMSRFADLFEPEELVGALWHRAVADFGRETHYRDAQVHLAKMRRRLEIFFRGLGGAHGVEIRAIPPQTVNYRKRLLARIGHASSEVTRARFDGDHLFLPDIIDLLPTSAENEMLYKWLAAWAAQSGDAPSKIGQDPFGNDIRYLRHAVMVCRKIINRFPGVGKIYNSLLPSILANRPDRRLPADEQAIEACIRAILSNNEPDVMAMPVWHAIHDPNSDLGIFAAKSGYRTFLPLILWGEIEPSKTNTPVERQLPEAGSADAADEQEEEKTRKAKREKSDQIERNDSLILHRFESILSWSEMMNINRGIEDEEEEEARKAADSQDELGLANIARKPATRLKFDLDLAPEDVVHERLAAKHTYPEWDYRKNTYHPAHCRVLARTADELEQDTQWQPDREARKRIRAVKRQFEALRPRREKLMRQVDGEEIDMDALIRSRCDLAASGQASNRVFSSMRNAARDLGVAVLIDTSRSSESWIDGRQVIEISKEALIALALGLAACGDDNAIYSFSSLRRDRVNVSTVKAFAEPLGPPVFSRIGALKPGFYTRLGAAMRHVTTVLAAAANGKKLLLVLSDGKPNDLDHYEGRYGVEDTARAVREARQAGIAVFGITIDKKAQSYFPFIFGQGAYSIAGHANDLTRALPLMYRHLVA